MPAGVPHALLADGRGGKDPHGEEGNALCGQGDGGVRPSTPLEDPEIIRRAKEELLRRTGGKTYQPPIPAEIQPKIPRDLFQTP